MLSNEKKKFIEAINVLNSIETIDADCLNERAFDYIQRSVFGFNSSLNKGTALHSVVDNNCNIYLMQYLVSQGANINAVDFECKTPLHRAVGNIKFGTEAVKYLLDQAIIDLTIVNSIGRTAHDECIYSQQLEKSWLIAKKLNEHLAEPEGYKYYKRYYDLCVQIIKINKAGHEISWEKYGDDLDFKKLSGVESPLYFATTKGLESVVQDLLSRGANPNHLEGLDRRPILHVAIRQQNLSLLKTLIDSGADVNILDRKNNSTLHIAAELEESGNIMLTKSAALTKSENTSKIIEILLQKIEDINLQNIAGSTALHVACEISMRCRLTASKCVETLLKNDKVRLDLFDRLGRSPLHYVVYDITYNIEDSKNSIPYLLFESGASVLINHQDKDGNSPINGCGSKVYCSNFLLMLKLGGDANICNKRNSFPHVECKCDRNHWKFQEIGGCPNLMEHFYKMELLGYPINEYILSEQSKFCYSGDVQMKRQDIKVMMKREIKALKEIILVPMKKKISLYDIIFMNKNHLMKYVKNEVLQKIYQDNNNDFGRRFKFYGYILNRHYRGAVERRDLMTQALNSLSSVYKENIPEECVSQIFKYCSDFEIKRFKSEISKNIEKN